MIKSIVVFTQIEGCLAYVVLLIFVLRVEHSI